MFFFFIPLGHEATWVRRTPVVTYIILSLMVLGFILTHGFRIGRDTIADKDLDHFSETLVDNPCVQLLPEDWTVLEREYPESGAAIKQLQDAIKDLEGLRTSLCEVRRTPGQPPIEPDKAKNEVIQAIRKILDGYSKNIFTQYGYIPAHPRFISLFTHVFLHGGFFHLIGNLLFFWLAAYALEDVWGRPVFLILFITSTIAALLLYSATTSQPQSPLIGASGAIAGLMGAFYYRMGHVNVRVLFVWWVLVRVGATVFDVSARIFLGFWFLKELFNFFWSPDNNIAYAAHLGGFLWGVLVAWLIRHTELETKVLAPHLEKKTIVAEADPVLKEAGQAYAEHDYERARSLIQQYLTRNPDDVDGWLLAFDIARDLPDTDLLRVVIHRLMEQAVRNDWAGFEKILDNWHNIHTMVRPKPSPRAFLACINELYKRNRSDLVIRWVDWVEDAESLMTPGLALRWIETLIHHAEYERAKEAINRWQEILKNEPLLLERLEMLARCIPV